MTAAPRATPTARVFRAASRLVGRRIALACLPYAGGGANCYAAWVPLLAGFADVWVAELAGRGSRFDEPPATDMTAIVGELATDIAGSTAELVVLFGHSMGATLAFETARELTSRGTAPAAVIVSGQASPDRRRSEHLHRLNDDALTEAMHRLGGTPREVMESAELWELMLPVIRADLALVEGFAYPPDATVKCPLIAYGATDDEDASTESVAGWAAYTTGEFSTRTFPGDHFYFLDHPDAFAIDVIRRLSAVLATNRPS